MRRDLTFGLFDSRTDYDFVQFFLTFRFGNDNEFFGHNYQQTSQDNGYDCSDFANNDGHRFDDFVCMQTDCQETFDNRLCFNFTETCDCDNDFNGNDNNVDDSLTK